MGQANINVVGTRRTIAVTRATRAFNLVRAVALAGQFVGTSWSNPVHPATRITMDADGGISIDSDVAVHVHGPSGGVDY